MAQPNITELVATTLRKRSKKTADNVSNGNALLSRVNARGNVRTVDGGRDIVEELEYAENATFKYYSGYEALDISPQSVIDAATFNFKQAAVIVSISGSKSYRTRARSRSSISSTSASATPSAP